MISEIKELFPNCRIYLKETDTSSMSIRSDIHRKKNEICLLRAECQFISFSWGHLSPSLLRQEFHSVIIKVQYFELSPVCKTCSWVACLACVWSRGGVTLHWPVWYGGLHVQKMQRFAHIGQAGTVQPGRAWPAVHGANICKQGSHHHSDTSSPGR